MRRIVSVALACAVWVLFLHGVAPSGMTAPTGGQGGAAKAPVEDPAAATCLSCCYLPCIESEMLYLKKAKDVFQELANRKTLTAEQYQAEQDRQLPPISAQTRGMSQGLAACGLKNLPDPARKEDYVLMRRWSSLKWSVEQVDGKPGHYRYNYEVKTDDDCNINQEQLKEYRSIMPCGGFADAVAAHEGDHVNRCEARKATKGAGPKTPKQTAQNEVHGYEAEYKYLDDLRQKVAATCAGTPCKDQVNEEEAKRLEAELKALEEAAARKNTKAPQRKRRIR